MMKRIRWLNLLLHIAALFSLLGTAACAPAAQAGPRVWIDFPSDGARLPSGTPVTVMSHAYAREGVAEVVLTIDGAAYRRDAPSSPGAQSARFSQDWQPPADGTYAVQVQAYGVGGTTSNVASITVRVGGTETATPVMTATLVITDTPTVTATVPTDTPTPTIPPPASIQFWAEPAQIQAGACTTIRWHVESAARVIFGGVDQPFDGSYKDCLCHSERYRLTVVKLDATEETRTVDIAVSGSCEKPENLPPPDEEEEPEPQPQPQPQPDTTPPPVPSTASPGGGQVFSCGTPMTLKWSSVSDPSTPVRYYVKLEIQVKKGQWQSAAGYGPLTVNGQSVKVQCGGIYRWMVRAEDGAGNASGWSAPSYFSIGID